MRKILLIDDEKGIRQVWSAFHDTMEATFRGSSLETASDLGSGFVKISETSDYDAIILDLALPPLDKRDVIEFIHQNSGDLPPIIVLTGSEDIATRRQCIIAGAAGFWTKTDAMKFPNLFFKELYNEYLKRYASAEKYTPPEAT